MAAAFRWLLLVALLACYATSSTATPDDDVFGYAAQLYFGGRYLEAQAALEPSIAGGSTDPRIWYFHGLSAWQSGDQQRARTDFQRGAALEKADPTLMSGVGTSLERVQGAARQALEQYRATARVASVQQRQVARLDRYRSAMQVAQGGAPAAATVASAPAAAPGATPPVEATAATEPGAAAAPAMTKAADDPFAAPSAPAAPAAPAADPFAAPTQPAMPAAPVAQPATPAAPAATPAEPADSPAAPITAALAAIDHPEQLWDLLPARYQSDVTGLVSEFGAKMDPEVWSQTFATLNKLNRLAATKRELIMKQPLFAAISVPGGPDKLAEGWDFFVQVFDTILSSELNDVEGLKNFDGKRLLSTTGRRMIQQLGQVWEAGKTDGPSLEKLKAAKVRVKSKGETSAVVTLQWEGQPPFDMSMTLVEGKWLPTKLVDGWTANFTGAKEAVAKLDVSMQKPQAMAGLAMANGVLDQLLAAKDEAEFNQALAPIMALMGGLGGAKPPLGAPPAAAPPAAPPAAPANP